MIILMLSVYLGIVAYHEALDGRYGWAGFYAWVCCIAWRSYWQSQERR